MSTINAERIIFDSFEEVVPKGGYRFETPPVLHVCIEDGLAKQEPWSLFVDIIQYNRALFEAQGNDEAAVEAAARTLYVQALGTLDVDEYEADMYWETYLDVEWETAHPYDLSSQETPEGISQSQRRVRTPDGSVSSVKWQDDGVEGPVEEIDPDADW